MIELEISLLLINILELLDTTGKKMNLQPSSNYPDCSTTPKPRPQGHFAALGSDSDSDDSSTHYALDHDVIMEKKFAYTVNHIEPGLFSGENIQTDLFFQLCEDILNSYPQDAKINYIKGRLRGAARSWFLIKYQIFSYLIM